MSISFSQKIAAAAALGLVAAACGGNQAPAETPDGPAPGAKEGCSGKEGCEGKDGCNAKDGKEGCEAKDGKEGCEAKDGKEGCKSAEGCHHGEKPDEKKPPAEPLP